MTTKTHRSPEKACEFERFMDLFHHDVHNLTDQEKKNARDACGQLLRKYERLSRDRWIYVLGRAFLSTYVRDRRDHPSTSCELCHFSLMLILFHEDLHRRTAAHDNDLEGAYQGVWACCLRLTSGFNRPLGAPQPEWIGVLGYLVHFIYDGDPRSLEPEEDCSLIA
jgi:hypothetical protein